MSSVLILNGPNLNLLGMREPEHYGTTTLEKIITALREESSPAGIQLTDFQSNAEHELIEKVQNASSNGIDFSS